MLKTNKELWGLAEVAEAIKMERNKKVNAREQEDYENYKEAVESNEEM